MSQTQPTTTETGTETSSLTSDPPYGAGHLPKPDGATGVTEKVATLEVSGEHGVLRGPTGDRPSSRAPSRWVRRGLVRGRSEKSRLRLLRLLASVSSKVRKDRLVMFITLSYPAETCPQLPATWTAHLKAFRKRLELVFGKMPVIPGREFGRRGGVHFHLILFVPVGVLEAAITRFIRRAWISITGDGSASHRRHGVHAEPLRSWRAASRYLAKLPDQAHQRRGPNGALLATGRTWSSWNADLLEITYRKIEIPAKLYPTLRAKLRQIAGQPDAPRSWVFADVAPTTHIFLAEHELLRLVRSLGIEVEE